MKDSFIFKSEARGMLVKSGFKLIFSHSNVMKFYVYTFRPTHDMF